MPNIYIYLGIPLFLILAIVFFKERQKAIIARQQLQDDFDSLSDEQQGAILRQRKAISLGIFSIVGPVAIPMILGFVYSGSPVSPNMLWTICIPLGVLVAIGSFGYAAITAIRYQVSDTGSGRGYYPTSYPRGITAVLGGLLGLVVLVAFVVLLAAALIEKFPWLAGGR